MQRLSGLDAAFLYMETPSNHMHVGSVVVLDPSTVPGGYSLRAGARPRREPPVRCCHRSGAASSRCRSASTTRSGSRTPTSTSTTTCAGRRCPRRAGRAELEEFAADVFGRALDRSRPLWEMYVVEGLEHGQRRDRHQDPPRCHRRRVGRGADGQPPRPSRPSRGSSARTDPPWRPDRVPDGRRDGRARAARRWPASRVAAVKAVRRTATMALALRRRNRQPDVTPPPAPFSSAEDVA